MGDSGSMLIGLMLAAASTTAAGPISQSSYGAKDMFVLLSPFLLVIAVMLVPALDALLAIIRRTRVGAARSARTRCICITVSCRSVIRTARRC